MPEDFTPSFNPEDFSQGSGLADDFLGTAVEHKLVPWTYPNGKVDHFKLALRVKFEPDEGQEDDRGQQLEPFVQHYSWGDLASFAPSNDMKEPVADAEEFLALAEDGSIYEHEQEVDGRAFYGLDEETEERLAGTSYVPIGARTKISGWGPAPFYIESALESMRSAGREIDIAGHISWFDGTRGHWNRVKMGGGGGDVKPGDPLVLTEFEGMETGKKSKAKKSKAKSTKASSKSSEPDESMDEWISEAVVALCTDNDGSVSRQKAVSAVAKESKGQDVTAKDALARFKEMWQGDGAGEGWVYDEEEGTISLA